MGLLWCLILVGPFLGISWGFYGIVVVFGSGRPICGIFMGFLWDFYGIVVGFCGIVMVFASGWPKTTEQIVELPWFQSKYIVFFKKIHSDRLLFK